MMLTQVQQRIQILHGDDSPTWNEDIVNCCARLSRYLMNKRAVYKLYSTNHNIDDNYNNPEHNINCAVYATIVLWKSGKLSKDLINRHGYLAANNVGEMARISKWKRLSMDEQLAKGDVLVNPGVHVAIYAGDGRVWDEYTGVIEDGHKPTGMPYPPVGGFSQFTVRYRPPQ